MYRVAVGVLLLSVIVLASEPRNSHRDYVPDEKTAQRIAEAVLISQFGEKEIKAQSPLLVDGSNKRYWIVEISGGPNAATVKGGGPAVWIDRHSGCFTVMDHMK